jgi:ribonuclease HI
LNTDGSCRDNGLAGYGGVIRGSDEEWLGGFAKGVGMCSTYMAEPWGVFEGLKYAKRLGLKAVKLNVDSIEVSDVLSNNENRSPIDRFLDVKIRHCLTGTQR